MKENTFLYYTLAALLFMAAVLCFYQPHTLKKKTLNLEELKESSQELQDCMADENKRVLSVSLNTPQGLETVYTSQETVGDFLAKRYLSSRSCLLISPSLETTLYNGIEITILPYKVVVEKIEEKIPFEVILKEDDTIEEGKRLVLEEGVEGVRELFYRVYYAGESEFFREPAGEKILVEAVDAVVALGTNPRAYVVASREKTEPVYEEGMASWYGAEFQGNRTTNGEIYDKKIFTAAHPSLSFNTLVRVTFLRTGKDVVVRINDRGPHISGRIIDLSWAAAEEIGLRPHGVGRVRIEVLGKEQVNKN